MLQSHSKMLLAAMSAASALTATAVRAENPVAAIPYPSELDAAAVVEETVSDLNREALIIGNGDLNALVWERNGGLCLRVAKNDVWDARMDTAADPALLRVDLAAQKWSGGGNPPSWGRPYPAPHCAGIVRIGGGTSTAWSCIRAAGKLNEWTNRDKTTGVMAVAGAADASAGYQANLPAGAYDHLGFKISGTPGARYYVTLNTSAGLKESGWQETPATETAVAFDPPPNARITGLLIYIQTPDGKRVENRIREITLTGGAAPLSVTPGLPPAGKTAARLDLRRAVATVGAASVRVLADRNVFLIETDAEVSLEEIKVGHLPAAELGDADGVKWLHLKMPGDPDYAGMEYAMAAAANGKTKAVALVSSRDTKENVRVAAVKLARETVAAKVATLIAAHEAEWARYWSASGVKLDDPDFQLWWYRMVYMMRCQARPGAVAGGLWTFQPTDAPNWHGDYHHNYNAWQPNWAPFIVNHPDLAEPWIRYMNEMLPRLRWIARETYGCEGACVGISSFAYEPDPATCKSKNGRQLAMTPWGNTMGMIGMSAQVLWYDHLYRPDRQDLEEKIYPVIREAALFFASFAEQCPRDANGKAKYGPSYSPEHGGFGVSNVPFDLAYARFTLKAAITGAGELGRDADLAKRFRQALDLLPDYPTAPDAAGAPVVVDWTGCKANSIGEHNITVPAVPVFPGDQITWFSPASEQELFRNTIRQNTHHRGCNSTIMLSVAKARLGMTDGVDDLRNYYQPLAQPNGMFYWPLHGFYLTESTGIAAGISEFLLQSVDNIIRVFPCWPKDKDASFENLRAQGGFLVSAEQKNGKVTKLEIISTVGGKLRLLDPWSGKVVEWETKPGKREMLSQ